MGKIKSYTKERVVKEWFYQTTDGKVFDNENLAIHHQREIDGEIKKCEACGGTGNLESYYSEYPGCREQHLVVPKCKKCSGKGWVERKVIWE